MKLRVATSVTAGLILVMAATPAAPAPPSTFGLQGQARALDLAVLDRGVTLGLALTEGSSRPVAEGLGAGQCTLLRDVVDLRGLPCSQETTETSRAPGNPGDSQMKCGPVDLAGLENLLDLDIACGLSRSSIRGGLPSSTNVGKVGVVGATLPVDDAVPEAQQAREQLTRDLTSALGPVLGEGNQLQDAVAQLLDVLSQLGVDSDAVRVELGPSSSNVRPDGDVVGVRSSAAGALVGVLGIPALDAQGNPVAASADPLTNGLLIIEVGKADASATVNRVAATASSAADAALLRVKVRDITRPGANYIEIPVAPGQSLTLFQGTPLESTIIAADSSTEQTRQSARAAADATSLHLLKGVSGGVKLGLGYASAAANVAAVRAQRAERRPTDRVLPVTGARDFALLGLALLALAGVALAARRYLASR